MKSPFPGMDPYLEPHWPGLHTHLVSLATADLNRALPQDLVARAEERLSVETAEDVARVVSPNVTVYQPGLADVGGGGLSISAPYMLVAEVEPATERFIRVLRADDGRLITVIEMISPANKLGGLEPYLQKRAELLFGRVHVVEIDLVRRGNWRAMLRPHVCPPEAVAPYRTTLRLGGGRIVYLYPMPLRQRLPEVPIPLRPGDKKLQLDLQSLLDRAYEIGGFDRGVDYRHPADPPLDKEDAEWAEGMVAGRWTDSGAR
jgi:hypothetical protein